MNLTRKRRHNTWLTTLLLVFALLITACQPAQPEAAPTEILPPTGVEPSVTVHDQDVIAGTVTAAEVISDRAGWIVIHADESGAPGPVIGHTAVEAGSNEDVAIEIDAGSATERLYAMLHEDAGTSGEYEFPGPDVPIQVEGKIVVESFQVTGGLASTPTQAAVTPAITTPLVQTPATPTLPETAVTPVLEATAPVIETPEEATPTAPAAANVSAVSNRFDPQDLTFPAGTTVIWTNQGFLPHTVTADDGAFDSGTLNPGDTFQFTFDQPGTYPYHCRFHGGSGGVGMSGTITVTGQ